MKVDTRTLDVTSNMQGEKVGMGIDENALAHIMSVLTDLYSNPELAVIREYSTNALDANVEVAEPRPIEVTLPSPLSPFFKVRDYGAGLDSEDIRTIYSRYGTSTKRNSNDAVGMLGLGCKSALTYTDQFTLTSVKDGIRTTVAISRDEDGSGSMTIVDSSASSDPSGTEVCVPAKSGNTFEATAADFFSFWTEGTVLVNGKAPKRVEGTWISDDIMLTKSIDRSVIVMGNVPYPFGERHENVRVVAFVPIGSVNFTPSRESLQMTKKTTEAIAEIQRRVPALRDTALQAEVDACTTHWDAFKKAQEVKYLGFGLTSTGGYNGNRVHPTYKGRSIAEQVHGMHIVCHPEGRYGRRGGKMSTEMSSYYLQNIMGTPLFVTGFESDNVTGHRRDKLVQYTDREGITRPEHGVYFVKTLPTTEWIDTSNSIPWATIELEKIVREKAAKLPDGRIRGSYDGTVNGTNATIQAEEIDTTKPLFWYHGGRHNASSALYFCKAIPGATIVSLPQNRIDKFRRDFPMAISIDAHYKAEAEKWWKGIPMETRFAMSIAMSSNGAFWKLIDPTRIDDPHLKHIAIAAKANVVNHIAEYKVYGHAGGTGVTVAQFTSPLLSGKYPLVSNHPSANLEHFYIYVNAVYAAAEASQAKEVAA